MIEWTGRAGVRVLACLGAVVVATMLLPLRWYVDTLAGPMNDPPGPVLIVLGAEVLQGPTIGEGSFWRSIDAAPGPECLT